MDDRESRHQSAYSHRAEDHHHPGSPHSASNNTVELYQAVFDHSNDAIFVIDPEEDCIVDANPRACAMLGYTREELLCLPISAIHPSEMAVLQAFAQSVFDNGRGWTNELSCQTKLGELLPAGISASVIQFNHEDASGHAVERRHIISMVRDITERRQAEAAERELALVEERNRLAREIHDSLAQGLTAIIWQLNASEMVVKAGGESALESLNKVRDLAKESLQEARRSVWDLRSGPLKGLSLVEALEKETAKIAGLNLRSAFNVTGNERVMPGGVEAAVLRICQEALANVLKHANASQVTVTAAYLKSGIQLTVTDNGIGFDSGIPLQWDKEKGGFGLISMRERAQLLGGDLSVKSSLIGEAKGSGTVVVATIPAPGERQPTPEKQPEATDD